MFKIFFPCLALVFLVACGADSTGSTVVTPTDTVSSTAKIQFNTSNSTITVLETGPDPTSEVFEACTFSMAPITGTLSYNLVDQDNLELGTGEFTYKRALTTPQTKAGVPSRVFSVWGTPEVFKDGVTLAFEVDVEPELLTFRMNCKG